jgi:hypothetical protein
MPQVCICVNPLRQAKENSHTLNQNDLPGLLGLKTPQQTVCVADSRLGAKMPLSARQKRIINLGGSTVRHCLVRHRALGLVMLCLAGIAPAAVAAELDRNLLAERMTKLSRGTQWKPVEAVPINFLTHLPKAW